MSSSFFKLTKNEQAARFRKLEKHSESAWKVTKQDWKKHRRYDEYFEAYEEVLEKTDTSWAPWTVIAAHDRNVATVGVFQTVIQRLEARIGHPAIITAPRLVKLASAPLENVDLTLALSDTEHDEAVKKYKKRIRELEFELYQRRIPAVIAFEGWDAAG